MILVAVRVQVAQGVAESDTANNVDGEVLNFVTEVERPCEA